MLIDSYAWVEFFDGTPKGKAVEAVLKSAPCHTPGICIAEISEACERRCWPADTIISEIKKLSTIILPDEKILQASGKINFERKKKVKSWGLVDSIILTTALAYGLNIVTGDKHFKDIEGTMII